MGNSEGPQTDYFNCVAWGALADFLAEQQSSRRLGVGDQLAIVGRYRNSPFTSRQGSQVLGIEIRIEQVQRGAQAIRNLESAPQAQDQLQSNLAQLSQNFRNHGQGYE